MKKILISAPSLDVSINVSGISALVGPLIEKYPSQFEHLIVGTPDSSKSLFSRLLYLFLAIFRLFIFSLSPGCKIFHLNTSADTPAIVRDFFLFLTAKIVRLDVVVHFHGGFWLTAAKVPWFILSIVSFVINRANCCVVLGADEISNLREKFFIKREIVPLPNYVADEYFFEKNHEADVRGREGLNIVFLGRLVESKSIDKIPYLVKRAIDLSSQVHFHICGDGPLRQKMIEDLGSIPRRYWTYCGVVSGDAKLEVLRRADIFILPSRSGEGMPIAMLEAMASSAIPVVTKLGAISDVIVDGVNGYMAVAGDFDDFSNKLSKAIASALEEGDVGRDAYLTAKKYDFQAYVHRLNNIYSII